MEESVGNGCTFVYTCVHCKHVEIMNIFGDLSCKNCGMAYPDEQCTPASTITASNVTARAPRQTSQEGQQAREAWIKNSRLARAGGPVGETLELGSACETYGYSIVDVGAAADTKVV